MSIAVLCLGIKIKQKRRAAVICANCAKRKQITGKEKNLKTC
jgi:hypothetical protein